MRIGGESETPIHPMNRSDLNRNWNRQTDKRTKNAADDRTHDATDGRFFAAAHFLGTQNRSQEFQQFTDCRQQRKYNQQWPTDMKDRFDAGNEIPTDRHRQHDPVARNAEQIGNPCRRHQDDEQCDQQIKENCPQHGCVNSLEPKHRSRPRRFDNFMEVDVTDRSSSTIQFCVDAGSRP